MSGAARAPRTASGDGRDRCICAVLLGGMAMLLLELRYEHRAVLGETWRAWIPLVYSMMTLAIGAIALLRWTAGSRRILAVFFGLGVAVGLLGLWYHAAGHGTRGVREVLGSWRIPAGEEGKLEPGAHPPALSPSAFCGLGTIGLLVCARSSPAGR